MVNFHVWVLSLDSIDEGSMTYAADIFMSQSWDDARLKIPDSIMNFTSEYRLLPLSWLERMWRPDSFFKNAKQVVFQEMTIPNHYIWLYPNKRILYMVKLTLLLSCAMKFQSYPHDTQYCNLQIESLSYTTNELMFEWEAENPLIVGSGIELPQHNLVSAKPDVCHQVYSSGEFVHFFLPSSQSHLSLLTFTCHTVLALKMSLRMSRATSLCLPKFFLSLCSFPLPALLCLFTNSPVESNLPDEIILQ